MTLESIYYIGQTVAVIAIVISLVFVGLQVRQSKQQTERANIIARTELSKNSLDFFLTTWGQYFATPDDAAFMQKALYSTEPLSEAEQVMFYTRINFVLTEGAVSTEVRASELMSDNVFDGGADVIRRFCAWPRPRRVVEVFLLGSQSGVFADMLKDAFVSVVVGSQPRPIDFYRLNDFPASSEDKLTAI